MSIRELISESAISAIVAMVIEWWLRGSKSIVRKLWKWIRPLIIPFPADALQVWTASNLDVKDSVVTMINTNTSTLCVNVYIFNPAAEMIAYCACQPPPNRLASFSCREELILNLNTRDPPPSAIIIKLLTSSISVGGTCTPCSIDPVAVASGLRVWGKTYRGETPFAWGQLGRAELKSLTTTAAHIQANGRGYGICKSCRWGAIDVD